MPTLYVDGEGSLADHYRRMEAKLKRYGMKVNYRTNGGEGIHLVRGGSYDTLNSKLKSVEVIRRAMTPQTNDVVPPLTKPDVVKTTRGPPLPYGAVEVMQAIAQRCNVRHIQFFGNSASDAYVYALTRDELDKFLKQDKVDAAKYTSNTRKVSGFDCENFAESLRVNAAKQNINSCAVIWGDTHAFNLFVTVGKTGPEIVVVEPQTDKVVANFTGSHAITRRCHILL